MKGIVFTEFMEMAESRFGFRMADKIISESDLSSNGIYTAVGKYNEEELFVLIEKLSKEANIDRKTLMMYLGEKLYITFTQDNRVRKLPFRPEDSLLEKLILYLKNDSPILYTEFKNSLAELNDSEKDKLIITYSVCKKRAELIEGLLRGAIISCKEKIHLLLKEHSIIGGNTAYTFILEKY